MIEVPEAENEAYICIAANRGELYHFLNQFELSVNLFELLERGGGPPSVGVFGGIFVQYRIIAARDGALNIYHFGCALEAVRKQLPMCPTLARASNPAKLRDACQQFKSSFPHADMIRHAVAHAGELQKNPKQMRRNIQKSDHNDRGFSSASGGLLLGALYDRTYSVGIDGRVFSLSLDRSSHCKLADIINTVHQAFASPA